VIVAKNKLDRTVVKLSVIDRSVSLSTDLHKNFIRNPHKNQLKIWIISVKNKYSNLICFKDSIVSSLIVKNNKSSVVKILIPTDDIKKILLRRFTLDF